MGIPVYSPKKGKKNNNNNLDYYGKGTIVLQILIFCGRMNK
jgi:hypothetical protein